MYARTLVKVNTSARTTLRSYDTKTFPEWPNSFYFYAVFLSNAGAQC
jgi:hypothetical protein